MNLRWHLTMAWRESRGSRARLLLFVSSITLGVAALVAIHSFGDSMRRAVDDQARALMGADMSFESRRPFSKTVEALADSLGGEQARRVSFSSMVYFPAGNNTRLASVRAIEGDFPFYGDIVTEPPEAAHTYRRREAALVDGSLASQFGVKVGDTLAVGNVAYAVEGILKKTARESAAFALVSPRVYVPLSGIDTTLIGRGSRVTHEIFFHFDDTVDVEATLAKIKPRLREESVGSDSVDEIKRNWNNALTNLYKFLGLAALMALLLGSVGVASAIHVYVSQRLTTVAVLRCLGARIGTTFAVYVVQAIVLGLVGSIAGAILGLGVQQLLPVVLADFLPIDVRFAVSVSAVAFGIAVGTSVTVLFALLPLLAVRRASPMMALRSAAGVDRGRGIDWLKIALVALLVLSVTAIAILQGPHPLVSMAYVAAVGVVCGILASIALGTTKLLRRMSTHWMPYVARQGIANLYRPNNQTVMLLLAIGLGTFLVATFLSLQHVLLNQIDAADERGRPNLVFFDIQPDQTEAVEDIIRSRGMPVVETVPIVTMRLHSVKGRTVEAMRRDSTAHVTWAHRREYRSTFRSYLTDTEQVLEGEFATGGYNPGDVVPVSIEADIAEDLSVGIGDSLTFDVQGVPIQTTVGSIRSVEWRQVRTNFFVVFPAGVLEEAPHFNVIVTRAETEAASGGAQAAVVREYPGVSSIDLSLILDVVEEVFDRIAFAVRFMAAFSILTGFIVLGAAVVVSRVRRVEESVLLKTLGASKRQVFNIMTAEYVLLGALAAVSGVILSSVATFALARFVFEAPFVLPLPSLGVVALAVVLLTVGVGLVTTRGVYARPALDVLRVEI